MRKREAEGYEALMQHSGLTADQVGEKIGKSRSYVYGVLKYLALSPLVREAFFDGKIDRSKALLVARIGNHKIYLRTGEYEPFGSAGSS